MSDRFDRTGRLVAVLCVGLALRAGLAFWANGTNPAAFMQPDSFGYRQLALNLLQHGVFSRSPAAPFEFEVFRTPGYPAFLAVLYFLFGTGQLGVVISQALLAGLTGLVVFFIGRRLFSPETGVLAAFFVSVDMAGIGMANVVMSEVLFGLLLVISLQLVLRSLSAVKPGRDSLLAGLVLAIAAFVRPLGYYLVPLLAALLLARDAVAHDLRRGVVRVGLFILAPVLLFGLWQGYRFARTGSARFSQIECLNMFWYHGCGALSLERRQPIHDLQTELGLDSRTGRFDRWFELHPETRGMSMTQVSERWLREGWRLVIRHPLPALLVHLRGLFVQLFDPGSFPLAQMAGAEDSESGHGVHAVLQCAPLSLIGFLWREHRLLLVLSVAGVLWLASVYAGVVAALAGQRPGFGVMLLVVVAAYCLIAGAGCEAAARFRVPVFPLIAVLAAQGWRRMLNR
ncbi:MAG: glycosyltransferase family 39 protein [candidate division WOR-3 bacterium]